MDNCVTRVNMFSINFVIFCSCKLLFCHDSLENVVGIDAFKWFPYQLPNKEYLITVFKISQFFVLPVIF